MTTPIEERVARLESAYEHLATKADLAEFRGEVRESLANVRESLASVRAEIAQAQSSTVRWVLGGMLTLATANIASVTALAVVLA